MSVYSINQRAFEQSGITPTTNKPSDNAIDFVAQLQKASSRFGGTSPSMPAAESAFKASFDRAANDARTEQAPEKSERAQPKVNDRDGNRAAAKANGKGDKPKVKDDGDTKSDGAAEAVADDTRTEPAQNAEAKSSTDDDQNADQQNQGQTAQDNAGPVAAAVQAPQQQTEQNAELAVTDELTLAIGEEGENAAAAQGKGQATDDAGEEEDVAASDDGLAGEDDLTALATTKAARPKAKNDAQAEQADTLAQAQADQLAESLNGTGAQVKIQVSTTTGPQNAAAETQMANAVVDPAALQQADIQGQNAPQSGAAATQSGGQNAAAAAEALAASAQADAALQQKAVAATPFAAIIAAQAEASTQNEAAAGPQGATPVAGLAGSSGTQAAQKSAAPQAAQAPRPAHVPQQHEVMDQLSVQIAKQAKDGNDTIKVSLKPVELGAIEIKLDVGTDGRVSATVTADNKDTLAILQKDSRGLEKALEDAGLKPDGSMTFNLRGEGQQNAANNGTNSGRGRRSRLSVAAAADAAGAQAAAAAQARWSGSRSGVDIKV